jgi:hypothetical protein
MSCTAETSDVFEVGTRVQANNGRTWALFCKVDDTGCRCQHRRVLEASMLVRDIGTMPVSGLVWGRPVSALGSSIWGGRGEMCIVRLPGLTEIRKDVLGLSKRVRPGFGIQSSGSGVTGYRPKWNGNSTTPLEGGLATPLQSGNVTRTCPEPFGEKLVRKTEGIKELLGTNAYIRWVQLRDIKTIPHQHQQTKSPHRQHHSTI